MEKQKRFIPHTMGKLAVVILTSLLQCAIGANYEECDSPQYLEYGKPGLIYCSLIGNFTAVFWYGSTNTVNDEPIITLIKSTKDGYGYKLGEFDITPDGFLKIAEVNRGHGKNFTLARFNASLDEKATFLVVSVVVNGPLSNGSLQTTTNSEETLESTTQTTAKDAISPVQPLSSTPGYRETTQPLGHPEIKKITPLEYSVAGGQEMVILGEYFRGDCEVNIMELVDDGTSVWNETCPIDKSLSRRTHILCTMPPYKDEYLKQPAKVFLVITCDGGYASELMDHPITYNPVPDDQDQNDDQWKTGFIVLLGVVFVLFVVAFVVWRRNSKKKNGQNLDENQGHGDIEAGAAGQNGCPHTEETELTQLQPNGHVERN